MDVREAIVWAAVGLSGVTAALYALIGLNVVSLGEIEPNEQRAFAIPATVVFAGGAVVAATWDVRWLWIVGAVGLAFIIGMYFSLADQREPRYETWGIAIRVVQFPLLAALVYLAFTN
jgi:hypothetical protein